MNVMGNATAAVRAQRFESGDSLDDFPTPPWATRALCRRLAELDHALHERTAWEPCCNRLHMARPLREVFGEVLATDIIDYGAGQDGVEDFLLHSDRQPDWIVTNPPFNRLLDFAEKALARARRGVAIFARLQALEGVERFTELFDRTPPTLVMPFAERVVLRKGVMLDPDVKIFEWNAKKGAHEWKFPTSATAYMWLVWARGEGEADFCPLRQFDPIGPCRRLLTHPGDYPAIPDHLLPTAPERAAAGPLI